ncbi:MAG: hypothetical protein HOW73_49165 [Polyangiaceae bacterium]|nr:hypothetical protein [Polyangiaceae bacterium]
MLHRRFACAWLSVLSISVLACGAGGEGASGAGSPGGSDTGGSGSDGEGGGFVESGGGGEGGGNDGPEVAEVFGHSAATLYRLDPDTKEVTVVDNFDGCYSVIDIALDKDSNLYATTTDGLYSVDKLTAECTLIARGDFPNSLSFIPAGTLDPNVESLVGYKGATYVRIDPATGQITNVGSLAESNLVSSGDIVSVKGGNTYLTVKGGPCDTDCLVEVNPVTGVMLKNWGPLGYESAFGIAFWAGSVYGFTDSGELFEVTFDDMVMTTTLIANPPDTSFWGAGSTTSAPPAPTPR